MFKALLNEIPHKNHTIEPRLDRGLARKAASAP